MVPLFGSSAYVFDFGGVLADVDFQVIRCYLTDSLDLADDELDEVISQWRAARKLGFTEEEFWTAFVLERDFELPVDWFATFNQVKMDSVTTNEEVMALVQNLYDQECLLALLSNIREDEAFIIHKCGYYDYFDPVLLSYATGFEKPDAPAYQRLIDELQLPPEEIFFVDDNLKNVEGALQMGIDAIHFQDAEHLRSALIIRGLDLKK